ncbi:uncharacterized protein LOC131323370 [Rhododendron vialii]|uniref:uncharacterized protein LOC131323370 n=1 Tax=Rhododendron vialii TaxID=182163 RepID=UPI0026602116|nr:uncharacterized protein LOC131323370 [Rhododendron vialii]
MKITSKSILSPNRHPRDSTTPMSLPPSLSRRLKTNRSLRGAQSPMFPTAGKKPRSAFDNPEPSSPKVTCIGQVRVKTKKKQGSKKQSIKTGEVSFRKTEGNVNPNQKWVHLPLTICEALRGFGAEFSCLFPCRPSCFSMGGTGPREKEGRVNEGNGGDSSCVAVFGRWLVGVQGREIELVVGGEGEEREAEGGEREIEDGRCGVSEECGVEIEEERRVSICVPPKNALLLMRCRSDPIRVSALVNRFWESPIRSAEEVEEEEEEDEDEGDEEVGGPDGERSTEDKKVEAFGTLVSAEEEKEENPEAKAHDLVMEGQEEAEERENPEGEVQDSAVEVQEEAEGRESPEGEVHLVMEVQEEAEEGENPEENLEISEEIEEEGYEENDELEPVVVQEVKVSSEAEENEVSCSVFEAFSDLQTLGNEENVENPVEDCQSREVQSEEIRSPDEDLFLGLQEMFFEEEEAEKIEETEEVSMGEKETQLEEEREEGTQSDETLIESEAREREGNGNPEREGEVKKEQENRGERSSLLPECLLLMMCEPKLSMEVSKETWVCGGDFIRWQPERRKVKRTDGCDGPRRRVSIDSTAGPASAVSMAALIEQKLVNAVAYEPFVLTRCKSEPMRTAAAKLAPETCFWKNRKLERLEPHRRATFGVGAAGVGF